MIERISLINLEEEKSLFNRKYYGKNYKTAVIKARSSLMLGART